MRANGLTQNNLQGLRGAGQIDGVGQTGASLEAQLAQVMSGPGMDVAALGLKKGLELRGQHLQLASALLNRERDSTQRVIDSLGA